MPPKRSKQKFYETSEFQTIKKEWDEKLRVSGFNDIEKGKESTVIQPEVLSTIQSQALVGLDYHQFCQQVLTEYHFKRPLDRMIFEKHAEGLSLSVIEEHLEKHAFRKLSKMQISRIINDIKIKFLSGV